MHCPFVSRFVKMEQALGSLNARWALARWHGWCPVAALGPAAVQHCWAAHCLRVQQQFFICFPNNNAKCKWAHTTTAATATATTKKQWNINCKRKIEGERGQERRRERTRKFCLCWVNLSCVRYILFTKCKCYLQSLKLKQIYTHPTHTTLTHMHTRTHAGT